MKAKILAVLLLIICSASALCAAELSAFPLYSVQLADQAMPADVVLGSDGSAGILNAYNGSYTKYIGGRAVTSVTKSGLKGGNCLVKYGNNFFFCNSLNNSLDLLSANLDRVASFKGTGSKYDPTDAVVSGGAVYTPDNDNHRVVRLSIATKGVVGTVGKYGENRLEFWYPYGIALDAKGVLYVSEVLGTRVQKITQDLKFYEYLGGWGIDPGQFYRTTGVAVFNGGTMLVGDGYTGVVQYFSSDGRFAGILKDSSGRKLKFGSVTHLRVSGSKLAVVDAYAKKVFVYDIKEKK